MQPHPHQTQLSLEAVAQTAKEVLFTDGHHIPTLIADGTQKTLVIEIAFLSSLPKERLSQLYLLGQKLSKTKHLGRLQKVFIILEGRMSVVAQGKHPKHRPSQDPQHKEVLIVSQRSIEPAQTEIMVFEIKRNAKKKLIAIQDFHMDQTPTTKNVESPLLEAFIGGFGEMTPKAHVSFTLPHAK